MLVHLGATTKTLDYLCDHVWWKDMVESIGMDFVGPLLESGNRDGLFNSIMVIICLLTLMVHLVPS